jgi:hypothetical protein
MKRLLFTIAMGLLILGSATQTKAIERKGFVIGFGGGLSFIFASDIPSNLAVAGQWYLGMMVSPKTALLLGACGKGYTNGTGASFMLLDLMLRFFLYDKIWFEVGLGPAGEESYYNLHPFTGNVQIGGGFTAAAGYELIQGRTFALDFQSRFLFGILPSHSSGVPTNNHISLDIGIGLTWY